MATLQTLGVDTLALRGTASQYHNLSRIFASLTEAQQALSNGDFVPVTGRANLVIVLGRGLMRYDDATQTLVDVNTSVDEKLTELLSSVGDNFDTFKELADAIGNDPNFYNETQTALQTLTEGLASEIVARTTADNTSNTTLATKAPLDSPALTGTPTAPTAGSGTNTTQVATTAFVAAAVADLINGAPGALDTINELANALGGDADLATTLTNSIAAVQSDVDQNELDTDNDIAALQTDVNLKAPLADPNFTGHLEVDQDDVSQFAVDATGARLGGHFRTERTNADDVILRCGDTSNNNVFEVKSTGVITLGAGLIEAADDVAAAAAGIAIGQLYRTGSAVMIRVS